MRNERKILVGVILLLILIVWLVVLSLGSRASSDSMKLEIEALRKSVSEVKLNQSKIDAVEPILPKDGNDGQSIVGPKGDIGGNGLDGDSAYMVAVKNGYKGNQVDWLKSLQGSNGLSAYELWLLQGNVGSEQDYVDSLKGEDARPIEMRCNANKLRNEWRYVGTATWYKLDVVTGCA